MFSPSLSPSEVNRIKVSPKSYSMEQLSSDMGRAKETIEGKVWEMKESERIGRLSRYARLKKKRLKHKAKRKIKGGM